MTVRAHTLRAALDEVARTLGDPTKDAAAFLDLALTVERRSARLAADLRGIAYTRERGDALEDVRAAAGRRRANRGRQAPLTDPDGGGRGD